MSRLSDRVTRRATTVPKPDLDATGAEDSVGIQPRSLSVADAESAHDAARAAWLNALRESGSGSNRALARLAVAQEAYEAARTAVALARTEAALEQQRLEAVRRRREEINRRAEAIAGQGVAWSHVHEEHPPRRGLLGRLFGRR